MDQPGLPTPYLGQAASPDCRLSVQRETDVPHVVAAARRFCTGHGLSPLLAAHVATAASELANNLWMHTTQGGTVSLRLLRLLKCTGIELVASDDGPGIADLALALREGYSSAGGMGCGLPGVRRLMDEFELVSAPGAGTRVRTCKWATPQARSGAQARPGRRR